LQPVSTTRHDPQKSRPASSIINVGWNTRLPSVSSLAKPEKRLLVGPLEKFWKKMKVLGLFSAD
jgi:hypothetical protein